MTGGPPGTAPWRARYRLDAPHRSAAEAMAAAIAREQTLEVPPGVGGAELEARWLGRVECVEEVGEAGFVTRIAYAQELVGGGLPQALNVLWGNVSFMDGVRLVEVEPPAEALAAFPGPRYGIDGLRALVGAGERRPLVSTALKPVGRTTEELVELARAFARAGVDVVKDDHGLVDQAPAPYRERVPRIAEAVARENARSGTRTVYFPNATAPVDELEARLAWARDAGCAGVVLAPSLLGLDVMRRVVAGTEGLAVMAHPTHAQTGPGRREGMAPEVLFGLLYRLAGADAVVYVNAGGRFAWPVETCLAVNRRLRAPLGGLRPAMPTPAGGVNAAEAAEWLERYGPDTMLLIGGSLLAARDVEAATRRVVEAARALAEGQGAGAPGRRDP